MSRREHRRKRWEQGPNIRPGVRANRERYRGADVDKAFDLGFNCGQLDEMKKSRERDDLLHRIADASEAASNGDPGPMDELAKEMGLRDDDLLDVADAAGVSAMAEEINSDRYERNVDMVFRLYEAKAEGPEAFADLAAEWGVPPEVLGKTSIDHILDVVEAAAGIADLEEMLRGCAEKRPRPSEADMAKLMEQLDDEDGE